MSNLVVPKVYFGKGNAWMHAVSINVRDSYEKKVLRPHKFIQSKSLAILKFNGALNQ